MGDASLLLRLEMGPLYPSVPATAHGATIAFSLQSIHTTPVGLVPPLIGRLESTHHVFYASVSHARLGSRRARTPMRDLRPPRQFHRIHRKTNIDATLRAYASQYSTLTFPVETSRGDEILLIALNTFDTRGLKFLLQSLQVKLMAHLRVRGCSCVSPPGVSLRGPKNFHHFPPPPRHNNSYFGREVKAGVCLSVFERYPQDHCSKHKVSLVSRRVLPVESSELQSAPFPFLSVLQFRWKRSIRIFFESPPSFFSFCVRSHLTRYYPCVLAFFHLNITHSTVAQ